MKQTFIFDLKRKLSTLELMGCLEDTLGRDAVNSLIEVKMVKSLTVNFKVPVDSVKVRECLEQGLGVEILRIDEVSE